MMGYLWFRMSCAFFFDFEMEYYIITASVQCGSPMVYYICISTTGGADAGVLCKSQCGCWVSGVDDDGIWFRMSFDF